MNGLGEWWWEFIVPVACGQYFSYSTSGMSTASNCTAIIEQTSKCQAAFPVQQVAAWHREVQLPDIRGITWHSHSCGTKAVRLYHVTVTPSLILLSKHFSICRCQHWTYEMHITHYEMLQLFLSSWHLNYIKTLIYLTYSLTYSLTYLLTYLLPTFLCWISFAGLVVLVIRCHPPVVCTDQSPAWL